MRTSYRFLSLITGVFVILLTISSPSGSGRASASTPTELKVLVLPFLSFAPYFIAQEEGYFAGQNLAVEFVQMNHAAEAVPSLIQGRIDVLGGFLSVGLLNAMLRDGGIRIVADKGYLAASGCAVDNFMVPLDSELPAMLSDPERRRNIRFSGNPTSLQGYCIEQLVAPYGLTLRDMQNENINDPAAELNALKNNHIEVAVASEPWVTRIIQAGAGKVWKPLSAVAPDFQSAIIAFGPTLLGQNRDAGERFMIAYLQGVRQYREGKTERNLAILAKYTRLELELLRQLCWPAMRSDGRINAASIALFAAWANNKGLVDGLVGEEMFWDGTFVDAANQALDTPR
jgi:ABC-type nitrate/sulfonate/bicarbonate transport system substrate-binding protein